jgi:hypothetical protein
MAKADDLQKLKDYQNDGLIDLSDMIVALGNYFSGVVLKEFVEFIEDEKINDFYHGTYY